MRKVTTNPPRERIVEKLRSGKYRARAWNGTRYVTVPGGPFNSRAAAFRADVETGAITAEGVGEAFLLSRRVAGLRDYMGEESRWRMYIENDPIERIDIAQMTVADVRDWTNRLHQRGLAYNTIKHALSLLSVFLTDCVERGWIRFNVARGMKLQKSWNTSSKEDLAILYPDQQIMLLNGVPQEHWPMVALALGSGIRQGEQWHLKLEDICLDTRTGHYLMIRSGSRAGVTKSGKVRRVPLFGISLEAARLVLSSAQPGQVYAFPGQGGAARAKGEPRGWSQWRKVTKAKVRWHDLRHTCATSLLAGWWGRKWTIDEICEFLGHSTVKVTERYARFLKSTTALAAEGTGWVEPENEQGSNGGEKGGSGGGSTSGSNGTEMSRFVAELDGRHSRGSASAFSDLAIEKYHRRSNDRISATKADLVEATRLSFRSGKDPIARARVLDLLEQCAERLGAA